MTMMWSSLRGCVAVGAYLIQCTLRKDRLTYGRFLELDTLSL